MDKKDEIIERIYTDPAGFGSIQNALKEVRNIDKSITREDVKRWIEMNTPRKQIWEGITHMLAQDQHMSIKSTYSLWVTSKMKNIKTIG